MGASCFFEKKWYNQLIGQFVMLTMGLKSIMLN